MSSPLLSIIIPVYNVEQYLCKCLDSVLAAANELGTNNSYEIICVDDGSPDSSPEILDEYEKRYSSIYVIHKPNGGLSDARNSGMNIAKGEYIYFIDSDDSITPDTFIGMLEQVRLHPGVDMVVAGAMTSEGNTRFSMSIRNKYPDYTEDKIWIKCMMIMQNIPMVAWNKLIKRKMLEKANLHFEIGLLAEDQPWNWMLSKHVNSIAFYKHDTYNYLIRQGSIINNPANYAKRWHDVMKFTRIYMSNVDGFLPNVQKYYIYYDLLRARLAPDPCSTIKDVKTLFYELSLQCSLRQRLAIWLTIHLPLCLLRKVGPIQRSLIDLFGQGECRTYDDRGLRAYFRIKK